MFILQHYAAAVLFCVITMLCWGSWANTQKLAAGTWRFELFYWDYVIGILLLTLLFAFTIGSTGTAGRSFIADLQQADNANLFSAFIGGVVFNAANILLVAAIAIAGMSVAFPVGIGIALVLGVVINYIDQPQGNPVLLFSGVALVAAAIVLNAAAYRKMSAGNKATSIKGLALSVIAGLLMGFFYRFVAKAMFPDFAVPEPGKLSPYTAMVLFAIGILASNFIFNTYIMYRPFTGTPVSYKDYFKGSSRNHFTGVLGGIVWCIGMSFSIIAAGKAGAAISYGLGQGATVVAAIWGIYIWKEFRHAPKGTAMLLNMMLLLYIAGLALIIYAR
ncbi:multidrug DMT transporter permease [Panacibacter sp. DH6]|uniref:Multidrug DMT transporter permease n=1 Tax=Panacibacter microcysteis TaxID=2793269 RepID=A0A931GW44_9BACT|nr:GRP family sugar transporter [Panacibacter microcysteis]MBG9377170.1 multidrug DMT transporter permease [Panacibacter microcysteis]